MRRSSTHWCTRKTAVNCTMAVPCSAACRVPAVGCLIAHIGQGLETDTPSPCRWRRCQLAQRSGRAALLAHRARIWSISTMSASLFGEAATLFNAAEAWLRTQQQRLKHNQLPAVIAELQPHLRTRWPPEEPVNACHRLPLQSTHQLDYQGALVVAYRSVRVRSKVRTAIYVQQRLKRPGALVGRRKMPNACSRSSSISPTTAGRPTG